MGYVSVRDHGAGMLPDVLELLFVVSEGHSRTDTAGETDTGFGMPLIQKIITLLGGRVEVETWERGAHPAGRAPRSTCG